MKRASVFVCVIAMLFALVAPRAALAQPISVYVNGRLLNFDVPPTVVQGRVLVPLRAIFQSLGATVDYDARTQHIVAVRGSQTVGLTIGSRQAQINNQYTLLDVPALTIDGRTMVPLRFVSQALGANVQWIAASRTILIGTGAAGTPPPAPQATTAAGTPPPAPQATTLSGRLVAVTTGQTPVIVVRSAGQDTTVPVTVDTAIYRYNAANHAGGSAALGSLRTGDDVTAVLNAQGQATKITATYHVAPGGKIARVNPNNRAVTLADGKSYVVQDSAQITLDGRSAAFDAIQPGRNARFLLVQGTDQAYEVDVTTPAASQPAPASVSVPTISAPANGAQVGSAFVVKGKARPGATVVVKAEPRLLGQAVRAQTVADDNGNWQVEVNVQSLPFAAFPYVVSAVQIVKGTQSDAASIEVSVK